MQPIVEARGVCVERGKRPVLRDLNLRIDPGETVGIVGPNGAGKTTLLDALLGLHKTSSGSLTVLDREPCSLRGAEMARFRQRVGYVPQLEGKPSAVPLTVREVVAISRAGRAGLGRRLRPSDHVAIDSWLERMDLRPLAARPYAELSGGQQKMAQLARAMAQEPEVLLLDEPAANLDMLWQESLVRHIEEVGISTGMTVLVVSHNLSLLPASCSRVAVLTGDGLAAVGSPAAVLTPTTLSALYGMAVQVQMRDGRYHVLPKSPGRED